MGQIGSWDVSVPLKDGPSLPGRVVATRLPAPLAAKAERRAQLSSEKKGKHPDKRSLEAAHLVMVFTTLSETELSD